jgi:hypothetical protein
MRMSGSGSGCGDVDPTEVVAVAAALFWPSGRLAGKVEFVHVTRTGGLLVVRYICEGANGGALVNTGLCTVCVPRGGCDDE